MHAEFRRCLVDLDVSAARTLWGEIRPGFVQPKTDHEALIMLHHARTQAKSIIMKQRAYSHRWLLDNGYPSGLPDELKPKAERMYPRVVDGVGISVNVRSEFLKPVAKLVQTAMSDAVMDAYADKKTDPAFVKERMMEAKRLEYKRLLG